MSTDTGNNASAPRFTSGSDVKPPNDSVSPLLKANGGRWVLGMHGQALEREFKFKTFAKTWDFMTAVSLQCKLKNHHPEWSNVFNTTFIRWTTHSPPGLSAKDIDLAIICDKLAADFGEVVPASATSASGPVSPSAVSSPASGEQGQGQQSQSAQQQQQGGGETCGLAGLADRVVGAAGDCCVPKGVKKE
ncbi:transcriptional coactivator/pterin dehydratase [Dichotomopilus funicola]|uniref:4a-hydroxytetrahydrobiopterin dehydratase n=1 Tax=Dichotomopilus funicola TaxID=1934379 RepID=A0AAN6ZPF6_9PEZI|nr:transcriptional coactivator/pterin dehydratase [Dichotomopilus funicola]